MPGLLAHDGAVTLCAHAGQARPAVSNPRVKVGGRPTALLTVPWLVTGCAPPSLPPCVTAQWVTGTTRVRSAGVPLVIQGGAAVCAPSGGPLSVVVVQPRVRGI
ncbi:hypothetical protein [Streptomyces sp. JHA26]|uniref:hypothetical protein n=1 Tax=Streptomyces sp. JHA26 TaxID=1917143 RepID=UPI00098AE5F4|nr:hypothetical protein [Streptomyces sp. JHA26]